MALSVSEIPSVKIFGLLSFNEPARPEIYTLSLHDALPILRAEIAKLGFGYGTGTKLAQLRYELRSEEHTSELQSHSDLVCRLLLEKKKLMKRSFHMTTAT